MVLNVVRMRPLTPSQMSPFPSRPMPRRSNGMVSAGRLGECLLRPAARRGGHALRRRRQALGVPRPGAAGRPRRRRAAARNPIDAFLLAKLEAAGLTFAPEADRRTLIRRAVLRPDRPAADARGGRRVRRRPGARRLREAGRPAAGVAALRRALGPALARPGPLRRDATASRPTTPRPTPGAIATTSSARFNADKPYDRFVREQLAGDELDPDDPEALIATGFNRHCPDEYNAVNLEQRPARNPQRHDRHDRRRSSSA